MKIIIIHYRFYESGGPETYLFNVIKMLSEKVPIFTKMKLDDMLESCLRKWGSQDLYLDFYNMSYQIFLSLSINGGKPLKLQIVCTPHRKQLEDGKDFYFKSNWILRWLNTMANLVRHLMVQQIIVLTKQISKWCWMPKRDTAELQAQNDAEERKINLNFQRLIDSIKMKYTECSRLLERAILWVLQSSLKTRLWNKKIGLLPES